MADLFVTAAHWRAASMFVSKNADSPLSAICVEPSGPNTVRLIAGDGASALLMRVRALHSLEAPVLIKPLLKNPKQSGLNTHVSPELDCRSAEDHPMFATPEVLARPFIEMEPSGDPMRLNPELLERVLKAAKLLGSSVVLQAQPINKPCLLSMSYGLLGAGEIALAVLMPLGVRDSEAAAVAIPTAWDLFCADEAEEAS